MSVTKWIARNRLESYLTAFQRRFLGNGRPRAVDVEVLDRDIGDQLVIHAARLLGVAYDPHGDAYELSFQDGDHRVQQPLEVWAIEESDGFVSVIHLVCSNGSRQIIRFTRVGLIRSH